LKQSKRYHNFGKIVNFLTYLKNVPCGTLVNKLNIFNPDVCPEIQLAESLPVMYFSYCFGQQFCFNLILQQHIHLKITVRELMPFKNAM
jgi:hypothetical protein